jgi:hypothetical protein
MKVGGSEIMQLCPKLSLRAHIGVTNQIASNFGGNLVHHEHSDLAKQGWTRLCYDRLGANDASTLAISLSDLEIPVVNNTRRELTA